MLFYFDSFSRFSYFWRLCPFWEVLVRYFVEYSSIRMSLMFFSWLDWGCGFWEDHRGRVPFASHRIKGTCHQHDLWLMRLIFITWLKKRLSGVSSVRLLSLLLSIVYSGGKSMHNPLLGSISLRGEKLYKLFFCIGDLALSPHLLIYFSHLFRSIWSHAYLFSTLGYNVGQLYLISWFGHWEPFQLASGAPFTYPFQFLVEHLCSIFWYYKMYQAHVVYFPLLS